MSTYAFELQIAYEVFEYRELSFDYKNSFRSRIEILQVDFQKSVNFIPNPVIANFDIRNSFMVLKNFHE